jgi:hypothetical protein
MMKTTTLLLSAARALTLAGLVTALSLPAHGAALFTLEGEAPDARLASESDVRLSVLGWTAADKQEAIVAEYQRYRDTQDHAAFEKFLQGQDTKGYLFTKSPIGHTIKYAWQENGGDGKRMVLLVTPALKSRNPYMWRTPNKDPAPFSLVELRFEGEVALAKASLDAAIEVRDAHLQLQDFAGAETFARMHDATPYYLKNPS